MWLLPQLPLAWYWVKVMDGWVDGWMDGWMGGWVGGWMDVWMDGYMHTCVVEIAKHELMRDYCVLISS